MSPKRWSRPELALVLALMLLAAFESPALASGTNKAACIPGPQGCKIGVENLECGAGGGANTGWHCKSTWKNKCLCFRYGIRKRGKGFVATSDWQTQPSGPLLPNMVTTFQTLPMAGNSVTVWEFSDPAPDSASAEVLIGPGALVGQCRVRLMNGPPDSIPVQIELLQLSLTSITFEGAPTGPNTIFLGSPSSVLGSYDSFQQILHFNESVPCTLWNNQYPAGYLIDVRPRAIPGLPGMFLFDLSATLWEDDPTGIPDPRIAAAPVVVIPNPSRDGATFVLTLPNPMPISLQVFDVSGRLVKRFADGGLPRSSQEIAWDGLDSGGREVAPGTYFVQLRSSSGYQACERFTIVR